MRSALSRLRLVSRHLVASPPSASAGGLPLPPIQAAAAAASSSIRGSAYSSSSSNNSSSSSSSSNNNNMGPSLQQPQPAAAVAAGGAGAAAGAPPSRGIAAAATAAAPTAGEGLMKDEYGNMDASGETFVAEQFTTEFGATLRQVEVRYNTFGQLNAERDNVLVVCHALTGNARLDTWWASMLGPGKAFDTDKYLIVCANILGSCYGTTGPMSINPDTGRPYGVHFPKVTIRDTVNLHLRMVKEALGARSVACVVGGSLGGMQAIEWALLGGAAFVRSAVVIACGARHTAWQIGISETQRQAIYADPNWRGGAFDPARPPAQGLSVARQIAMFSYRTPQGFDSKFGRETHPEDGLFQVRRYLEYQGQKFLTRFDALTYVRLTEKMDTHDVGRNRGGVEAALRSVQQPVLVLGIDSDVLYPLREQEELAGLLPQGELKVVHSREGHDGFLLEQQQVGGAIADFLGRHRL